MQASLCFKHGLSLASRFKEYLQTLDWTPQDIQKATDIAQHVFPVLVWGLNTGPKERCTAEIVSHFSMFTQSGVASWVLLDQSMPQSLRENLFPLLRPELHEAVVKWWDQTVMIHALVPFFKTLESRQVLSSVWEAEESVQES